MRVVSTSISWTASHTLVVWSIIMVGHVKKSYGRLAWPTMLWTRSARVSDVVGTCVDGQRFKSLNHWWSLSYCMAERHEHWTPICRGESMSLVINAFAVSLEWLCVKSATAPWDWIKAYYHHSPPTSTPAIWACGTVALCYPEADCACRVVSVRDNPGWRRPRGRPTKFMGGATWCFLLGVSWYGKGACIGAGMGWSMGGGQGDVPLGIYPQWLMLLVQVSFLCIG